MSPVLELPVILPLLSKPIILLLAVMVVNRVSAPVALSEQACFVLTVLPLDEPVYRDSMFESPATAPATFLGTPEPAAAFTGVMSPSD